MGTVGVIVTPRVTAGPEPSSKQAMTMLRAALPLLRAVILASLAIYLILFAFPAVLGIAAAATP